MPNFKKKPVTIEARQFTGDEHSIKNIIEWADNSIWIADRQDNGADKLCIMTLEGIMTASIGDWIIKGVHDEFYACKPDIFEKTYEDSSIENESVIDILTQIKNWDGQTNSVLGTILKDKFEEIRKKQMMAWD